MKRFLFLCLFLLVGSVCPAQNTPCPDGICPSPGQEAVSLDAVLRVRSVISDRSLNYGSGAVVQWGEATAFLTAWHVVKPAPQNVAVRINGRWQRIDYIYADKMYDFALYSAPAGIRPLPLGVFRDVQPGTPVFICGFGGDGQKCKTTAYFQGHRRPQAGMPFDWMNFSGAAISGDSGGPIMTSGGIVVGCVWGANGKGNVSVGTNSRRITATIDELVKAAKVRSGIENCQYTVFDADPAGFCRPCQPRPSNPSAPGFRAPVPDPPILTGPILPQTPTVSPNINVTIPPQDQSAVVAGWVGALDGKLGVYAQRLDATEQAVGQAIGAATEIVRTTNGRLTTLETQAILAEREREKLPETMVAVSKDVFQSQYPTICLIAVGVCVGVLLVRRWLDKRDGVQDGMVDFKGLYYRRRAIRDARDGVIDLEYPEGYAPTDRNYGRASDLARTTTPS